MSRLTHNDHISLGFSFFTSIFSELFAIRNYIDTYMTTSLHGELMTYERGGN